MTTVAPEESENSRDEQGCAQHVVPDVERTAAAPHQRAPVHQQTEETQFAERTRARVIRQNRPTPSSGGCGPGRG